MGHTHLIECVSHPTRTETRMGKMKELAQELQEQGFKEVNVKRSFERKYIGDNKVGYVWVDPSGAVKWIVRGNSSVDNLNNIIKFVDGAVQS